MTVALLPPRTSSGGDTRDQRALETGPSFIRNGRGGDRWHRPRSAVEYGPRKWAPDGYIVWRLWCGSHAYDQYAITRDRPPTDDEPVCGTCEGRAVGAGQIPGDTPYATIFSPRYMDPPRTCPGSKSTMFEEMGPRVGRCLVCGAYEPLRGGGGPYNGWWGLRSHAPGKGIIEGCEFHGWNQIVEASDQGERVAVCRCRTNAAPW